MNSLHAASVFISLLTCTPFVSADSLLRERDAKVVQDFSLEEIQAIFAERSGPVDLVESQISPDPYSGQDKWELIMSGELTLMNVHVLDQNQIRADFCKVDFTAQKEDPSTVPMYKHLVGQSRHCQEHPVSVPLDEAARACRERDAKSSSRMHSMDVSAFIFHQAKSGSSLVANIIATSRPDQTRVVSETSAVANLLRDCLSCSPEHQQQALKDTIYLLGRTSNKEGQYLYIKVPPSSTTGLSIVREAFPYTKWLFIYRDANTVLQKLMNSVAHRRVCSHKKRRNPGAAMMEYLAGRDQTDLSRLNDEEVCAASMAINSKMAREEHEKSDTGRLVQYDTDLMTNDGIRSVLEYLEIVPDADAWNRIEVQRHKRSNGRGEEWTGDKDVPEVSSAVANAIAEHGYLML